MSILLFTIIMLGGAFMAGLLGSLTGLGGGVVLIPLLTLVFHVDIRYAVGASLVASIANSSGAAAAYIKERITNVRIGMFLEIATTTGAIVGAVLAAYTPTYLVAIIFGVVLLFSAAMTVRKKNEHGDNTSNSNLARVLKLNSAYPVNGEMMPYKVRGVIGGYLLMMVAGTVSGLLGIGSGALKVLAMDNIMRIPFKVSTTTSNFMIGVTAAASAVIYFQRGYIDPGIAMPVVLGVLAGAFAGSKLLMKMDVKRLRLLFSIVISALAIQMIIKGINGNI